MLGNYEIRGELGRGAMGVVYHAFDPGLQREVAIKVLKDRPDARSLGRFRHEGQAAARVQHPNVLTVHDLVIPERGSPYLVTDYAPNGSLRDRTLNKPRLEAAQIVAILDPLLAGVAALHAAGVVHRDLKPENILFDEALNPLVADLGLARAIDRETRYTQSGVLTGTPAYMAPEQLTGKVPSPATDVYALGVILYELLCEQIPFEATSLMEQIDSLLRRTPEPPSSIASGVDPVLEAICLRCLAKDPTKRYADAAALREAVLAWSPGGDFGRLRPWLLPAALTASLLGLVAILALALLDEGLPPPPSATPSPRDVPASPEPPPDLGAPDLLLNSVTLARLDGLEGRRLWSLQESEAGLRFRSHNGDGAQLTLPIRFRRSELRIRARYRVRRLHLGTALRLSLVPERPINPGGRPGGQGVFSCALVSSEPDQRSLLGVRVSYRSESGGRPLFDEVGFVPATRSGPRDLLLDVEIGPKAIVVRAGGQTKTFATRVPAGEYRLELGPSPQGYVPDDPSLEQGFRTPPRNLVRRDFEPEGYDVVLRGLEIHQTDPGARLVTRRRADAWAELGTSSVEAWANPAEALHFKKLANSHHNPHIRDEAVFMTALLLADASVADGTQTLEALERLYLDSKSLNHQTWWYDDVGYGLEGRRLEAWARVGVRVNDLPRNADAQLDLARRLLGIHGSAKISYHAAARALYCLLSASQDGRRPPPELGIAWLHNGDFDRAWTILARAGREEDANLDTLYYAGLTAYWQGEFSKAVELWGRLSPAVFVSEREQLRLARARRLARKGH